MISSRHQRKTSPVSVRVNGSKASPLSLRTHNNPSSRSSISPYTDTSPLSISKSNPALSYTARNRQTSLKELVNKFNQTPDEIPPLPRRSTSRSTSATSSPLNAHQSHGRVRTPSQSKGSVFVSTTPESLPGQEQSEKAYSLHQRRKRTNEDAARTSRIQRTRPPISSSAHASQSMIDLSPKPENSAQKPLFGEILLTETNNIGSGYGIPGSRRRRGSEGSMHSPNPMFPDERDHFSSKVSPLSPSAWYVGPALTLEGSRIDSTGPCLPPGMHRRTRSDIGGTSSLPSDPGALGTHVSIMSPPQDSPSPTAPVITSKRNSQSRIPLSTRRMSMTSDSGNSTSPSRANSAMGNPSGPRVRPPKGISALPIPSQKPLSPVRIPKSSPSRNAARHRDYSPSRQHSAANSHLKAYISAPPDKKSPPLRSSRPRQPVSTASTSASRARAAERFGAHTNGTSSRSRENRSKKLPELSGVDFAARRQRIEQAVTKTVKENERKEEIKAERQRMSMALESGDQPQRQISPPAENLLDIKLEQSESNSIQTYGEDNFEMPDQEWSRTEPELSINTAQLSERSVLDLSQEDSPTLGVTHRFSAPIEEEEDNATPPSDPEPMSAVTAGTTDTADTFFDNEPQEDSSSPYEEHRSLLSHVMSMRDTSPTSLISNQHTTTAEDSVSEKDDQESIQIMLGDTPVNERADDGNDSLEEKFKAVLSNESVGSRWSSGSWTSAIRTKDRQSFDHERDGPMERIDEHSPPQLGHSTHTSYSTINTQIEQPWSPATFSSPRTGRTTLDSDGYSTINRVLDQYHDPSMLSPEMMNHSQQQTMIKSPDLARAGGWDPKKVTQLYLQELKRSKLTHSNAMPEPLKFQSSKQTNPELPTSESKDFNPNEKTVIEGSVKDDRNHSNEDLLSPRASLDADHGILRPQRASLNDRDDWVNTSPSIMDWIHPQAADSPVEDRPTPPPKDWRVMKSDVSEIMDQEGPETPTDVRPHLPEIKDTGQGLGLAINVESPRDDDSPKIPHPPLPSHAPPPPPVPLTIDQSRSSPPERPRSPPSPSIYSKHPASTIFPNTFPQGIAVGLISGDPSVPSGPVNSLAPTSNSPSQSQGRPSLDTPTAPLDAAVKETSPSPDQKRLTRRRHIIKELVDTEHSFGQDMVVVDDIYKGTSNVIIISADDVKTLFGNSDQIVAFSASFLDALKQASKSVYVLPKSRRWRSKRASVATSNSGNTDDQSSVSGIELSDEEKDRKTFIGEQFGHHMANMEKIYSDYLKNHDAANQKLQVLQKNPKVQIWLKECRAYAHDLTTAWDLDSLLVKPVQRILKYPLLLDQLVEVTPEDHPDYTALEFAAREMKGVSMRINEMKKRADLMEQVVSNRKRKDTESRIGLSKAFGRRTEKLRQNVGFSDMVDDREYNAVSERFGSHFFQLQVVMRDVEMYAHDVQIFMNRFCDFVGAIEQFIDVGQTNYPEIESKWRKFRMSTKEMSAIALADHVSIQCAREL